MSDTEHRAPGGADEARHRATAVDQPAAGVRRVTGPFVDGPRLLAAGRAGGPLRGRTFAAKDLFDVAGLPTGAGNPAWLADAGVADRHAPAVQALLDAGADLVGKTHTDELAWSISGTNAHYGTPVNPAAPGRAPGGSSSGSASAVAAGAVDLALGSDTGGSIRVPASYCGIAGLRPTHGRVPVGGMVPLAPSFDTVGLLARTAADLRAGWRALSAIAAPVAGRALGARRLVVLDDLVARCDRGVDDAVVAAAHALADRVGLPAEHARLADDGSADVAEWVAAFRVLQGAEVWQVHGEWLTRRRPPLGPGVASRVAWAASPTAADVAAAAPTRGAARRRLAELLGDDAVLAAPAAPTPAHPLDLGGAAKDDLRARTLACAVAAGMGGLPSLALPLATSPDGLPIGLCLLGGPGDDDLLLDLAMRAAER